MFSLILLFALALRIIGINWDSFHHLHPDERMIIMVTDRLHFPTSWSSFFSPESPLNPKFFAYGSFPIYLLKLVSWFFGMDNYDGMLIVGRSISVFFDLGTVILVYFIAKKIVSSIKYQVLSIKYKNIHNTKYLILNTFPLLAMFFYSVSVLPIQSSHFFISDMPLTFFSVLLIYFLVDLMTTAHPFRTAIKVGLTFGLALATKVTAVILAAPIAFALFLLFIRTKKIKTAFLAILLIGISAFTIFSLTMPYGLIDFSTFLKHTQEQSRMRYDPYIFPFTLQYVGTTPYVYFLKNILLWGMGIPLGLLAFLGTAFVIIYWLRMLLAKIRLEALAIILFFFFLYFLFMGKSAVKFMRYMLPLYPFLSIFAAFLLYSIYIRIRKWCVYSGKIFLLSVLIAATLWPLSFLTIFFKPHTRITASNWIITNIPSGSKLAVEHWDDLIPIYGSEKYRFLEMPMYESDEAEWKWKKVEQNLKEADYIILASNRLYAPLQRLSDCNKYKRCYPKTAVYYQNLFNGKLGFTKAAEFTSYPTLPLITQLLNYSITIPDDSADESFTVYDHPKIMIFKKISPLTFILEVL